MICHYLAPAIFILSAIFCHASPPALVFTEHKGLLVLSPGDSHSGWTCKFRNQSQDTVEIVSIQSQCDCITAEYPPTIGPASEGSLVLSTSSRQTSGSFQKEVLLLSKENGEIKRYLFQLQIIIEKPLILRPRKLYVGRKDDKAIRRIEVKYDGSDRIEIISIEEETGSLASEFSPSSDGQAGFILVRRRSGTKLSSTRILIRYRHRSSVLTEIVPVVVTE